MLKLQIVESTVVRHFKSFGKQLWNLKHRKILKYKQEEDWTKESAYMHLITSHKSLTFLSWNNALFYFRNKYIWKIYKTLKPFKMHFILKKISL
jgi:hypothetical protein